MLVFRTLPLAAAIGSPWKELVIAAISAGLILFGIGVAINYNGLANRTANVVAGNPTAIRSGPRLGLTAIGACCQLRWVLLASFISCRTFLLSPSSACRWSWAIT